MKSIIRQFYFLSDINDLQTNFFKFLVEKYKEEIEDLENEITPEESNLKDEDLVDEVDVIDKSQKLPQSQSQNEPELDNEFDEPNEELIEKIINLISKKQKIRNGSIRRKQ